VSVPSDVGTILRRADAAASVFSIVGARGASAVAEPAVVRLPMRSEKARTLPCRPAARSVGRIDRSAATAALMTTSLLAFRRGPTRCVQVQQFVLVDVNDSKNCLSLKLAPGIVGTS
jgi:hypothetical protein